VAACWCFHVGPRSGPKEPEPPRRPTAKRAGAHGFGTGAGGQGPGLRLRFPRAGFVRVQGSSRVTPAPAEEFRVPFGDLGRASRGAEAGPSRPGVALVYYIVPKPQPGEEER
jgi:hypothetical protein